MVRNDAPFVATSCTEIRERIASGWEPIENWDFGCMDRQYRPSRGRATRYTRTMVGSDRLRGVCAEAIAFAQARNGEIRGTC